MHYLGREYLFRGRWDDCIATLKKHLSLPAAVWVDDALSEVIDIVRIQRTAQKSEQMLGDPDGAQDVGMLVVERDKQAVFIQIQRG